MPVVQQKVFLTIRKPLKHLSRGSIDRGQRETAVNHMVTQLPCCCTTVSILISMPLLDQASRFNCSPHVDFLSY